MAFFKVGKPDGATMHSSSTIGTNGTSVSIKHWYCLSRLSTVDYCWSKTLTLSFSSICLIEVGHQGQFDDFQWFQQFQIPAICVWIVIISSIYVMCSRNMTLISWENLKILFWGHSTGFQKNFSGPIVGLTNWPLVQDSWAGTLLQPALSFFGATWKCSPKKGMFLDGVSHKWHREQFCASNKYLRSGQVLHLAFYTSNSGFGAVA